MTIKEVQEEVIEEFAMFDTWMDKYEHIIELGKDLPDLDEEYKTKDNIVKGCQSQVWLHTINKDEIIYFEADSDAIITKGLVALMVRVLSGHRADDIVKSTMYFVNKIGLAEHLSPTRSNGLLAMIKQMKLHALAFSVKQ
ncbi:MAG: SufE family protein [Bacteroidetes bacterium]|nr:SufE family protein [Bacteroidota bacterium]